MTPAKSVVSRCSGRRRRSPRLGVGGTDRGHNSRKHPCRKPRVAIQVTYHPGWHATANGKGIPVSRDGLGLMWLDSPCTGPCEIQLRI